MKRVTVVDYGLGNLHSVERAITHLGAEVIITSDTNEISQASSLILPGVGSFREGMMGLEKRGLIEPIRSFAMTGRPLLGICLGMQLLMSMGDELGMHTGLNVIKGKVVRLPFNRSSASRNKVPHIGWSLLERPKQIFSWDGTILQGLGNIDFVYFVHSYVVMADSTANVLALTTYGGFNFSAVIKQEEVYGCQFHPEKSDRVGLKILENFLGLTATGVEE